MQKHNVLVSRYVFKQVLYCASVLLFCFNINNSLAAVVDHSGTISAQTTWASEDIHRITGNVTVYAGVILTIEPGAIVKFNNGTRLDINGALDAKGSPSNKIIFTSYRDDEFGGDTNGDGESAGQPGDWRRIYFSNTTTATLSAIDHAIVRYAGSSRV